MLNKFYDPGTLALVAGASTAVQALSNAGQASAAADGTSEQIKLNRLQRDRELEDLKRSDNAKLSRQRAVAAATGGDLSFGSTAKILENSERRAAKGQARLLQDFDFQRKTLKANRATQRRAVGSSLFFGALNTATAAAGAYQAGGGDLKTILGVKGNAGSTPSFGGVNG